MLNDKWLKAVERLDYAFQPIVSCYTGRTYAVEALIRGTENAGFEDISDFFDKAHEEGYLSKIDYYLREMAIKKFVKIPFYREIKLFYNYDPRIIEMPDYRSGETEIILSEYGLSSNALFFELTEKYSVKSVAKLRTFLIGLKKRGIKIALDDFGSGFAGLELLYHSEPDLIKFDRFLISGLNSEIKKRNFCSHILSLSKSLSIINLAEGIENENELITCKDLHFDLIQGFFIARPTCNIDELSDLYPHIANYQSKRKQNSIESLIEKEVTKITPIIINENIKDVVEKFRNNHDINFLPVVDSNYYPVGIINVEPLKKYLFHPYGYSLISNPAIGIIDNFIYKCPVADIRTKEGVLLSILAGNQASQGIIIIKELKYYGFLTVASFINIMNEKKMYIARESNPLTRLPGNNIINDNIQSIINNNANEFILAYWDLDNFKPFNDKYGFRQGDRAILYFADLLQTNINMENSFVGHIGGDDFFTSFDLSGTSEESVLIIIQKIIHEFTESIASIHSPEEFSNGYYLSKDRNNHMRKIPLLTVSCALIKINPFVGRITVENISEFMSGIKKKAKKSQSKIAYASVEEIVPVCHL